MNFLAHGFLSGSSDPVLVGNFIGDFVKGRQIEKFDPEIAKGITLHRKIDEYTDLHPVVIRSKNRIRDKYRHYTGVIVDIFYDHFLAINWNTYSTEPLNSFCKHMYEVLFNYIDVLPSDAKQMLPWMVKNNWLLNYASLEGIDRSLKGMSRRTNFNSGMENAIIDLKENYSGFNEDFTEFFPNLIRYAESI